MSREPEALLALTDSLAEQFGRYDVRPCVTGGAAAARLADLHRAEAP